MKRKLMIAAVILVLGTGVFLAGKFRQSSSQNEEMTSEADPYAEMLQQTKEEGEDHKSKGNIIKEGETMKYDGFEQCVKGVYFYDSLEDLQIADNPDVVPFMEPNRFPAPAEYARVELECTNSGKAEKTYYPDVTFTIAKNGIFENFLATRILGIEGVGETMDDVHNALNPLMQPGETRNLTLYIEFFVEEVDEEEDDVAYFKTSDYYDLSEYEFYVRMPQATSQYFVPDELAKDPYYRYVLCEPKRGNR